MLYILYYIITVTTYFVLHTHTIFTGEGHLKDQHWLQDPQQPLQGDTILPLVEHNGWVIHHARSEGEAELCVTNVPQISHVCQDATDRMSMVRSRVSAFQLCGHLSGECASAYLPAAHTESETVTERTRRRSSTTADTKKTSREETIQGRKGIGGTDSE